MELNEQIMIAREEYEEAQRARRRLDELSKDLAPLRERIDELAAKRAAEEKDVQRLEGGSLAAFFWAMLGKGEEKLDKEKAEALEAAVRHDAACAELKALDDEIALLIPAARSEHALRFKLENLLAEKKAMLEKEPETAGRIAELQEECAGRKRYVREVKEARRAAQRALSTAKSAVHELEKAEGYGNWDVLGGGKIADYVKHEHMDEAQAHINRLQSELRLLRNELADVRMTVDVQVQADGFDKFVDMFWDNIFTDWDMLGRIEKGLEDMRRAVSTLEGTMLKLERMQSKAEAQERAAQAELEAFIEAH